MRITPAGAGKTNSAADCGHPDWDHPRRCGENGLQTPQRGTAKGSPPQVRGKRHLCRLQNCEYRITPAGAGKTPKRTKRCLLCWDHPRRCGENSIARRFYGDGKGSPPQVRGKPSSLKYWSRSCGITPAGAGKTSTPLRITYPR